MAKQVEQGKSFEYAIGKSICTISETELKADDGLNKYIGYYDKLEDNVKERYSKIGEEICNHAEDDIEESTRIILAGDYRSRNGDNRDLILFSNTQDLQSGFSIKKNSKEVFGGRLNPGYGISNWVKRNKMWVKNSRSLYLKNLEDIDKMIENFQCKGYAKFIDVPEECRKAFYKMALKYFHNVLNAFDSDMVRILFRRFIGFCNHYQIQYDEKNGKCYVRKFYLSDGYLNEINTVEVSEVSWNTIQIKFPMGWIFRLRIKNGSSRIIRSILKISITMESCPIETYTISV